MYPSIYSPTYLLTYLSERQRSNRKEKSSMCWFTPHTTATASSSQSQVPEAPSWSPTWVKETQRFGLSATASPGMLAESRIQTAAGRTGIP